MEEVAKAYNDNDVFRLLELFNHFRRVDNREIMQNLIDEGFFAVMAQDENLIEYVDENLGPLNVNVIVELACIHNLYYLMKYAYEKRGFKHIHEAWELAVDNGNMDIANYCLQNL